MNSCNPFFISLGQSIGAKTFSKYFKAFGLTEKTGIDLAGEASSQYHSEANMGPTEPSSTAFGQTFKDIWLNHMSLIRILTMRVI